MSTFEAPRPRSGRKDPERDQAPSHVPFLRSPDQPALEPGGRPLDASVRAAMESRFGHDFSQVRVHSGEDASRAARELGARAFTVGRHIVMGEGQYRPRTSSGWRLLRHELAHAAQQEHFDDSQIGSALVTESHDAAEAEARAGAGAAVTRLAEPAIQLRQL